MAKAAGKKATADDARIVMKLYDLRREAEMRKARNWFGMADFSTWEAVEKVAMGWGTQENAWFRQYLTYWENAASLVLRGAVNSDLFFDWNGEIFFAYVKIKPYIQKFRQGPGSDQFLEKIETLLSSTPALKKRVAWMEAQFKKWNEMQKAKAAGKS